MKGWTACSIALIMLTSPPGRWTRAAAAAGAGPSATAAPVRPPGQLPDVRRAIVPTIIEDLDDLGPAVVSDPLVAGRVETLARRRRTAVTVGWTSLLVGLGLTTLSVATMEQHCGGRVCRVSPSALQWWGVGSGLAIAAGGLFTAYHLSPDPKAIERTLEPWNLRHPDRPLAMLRNNCLESSDRDCTHGPTMALPPAMLMTAGILSIRGRFDAFNPNIRSGPFRTTAFDRGVIHDSTEHRGKRYEKAYRHESSLRMQGLTASAWDVRCREWRKEAGRYEPGHHVTGQVGPFHIDSRREARYQPTSREEENTCRLTLVSEGEGEGGGVASALSARGAGAPSGAPGRDSNHAGGSPLSA